jgi:hypothetical protein
MPWRLKAQYQTQCVVCNNTIHPDEWIVENGGVWVHDVCPKQSAQASKRGRAKGARPVSKDNSTTQAAQQQPQYVTREQFKKVTDYVKEMAAQFNALESRVQALEIRVETLEAARQHLEGEQAILERVRELEHHEGMRQNEKVERQAMKLREKNGFAGRNAALEAEAGA